MRQLKITQNITNRESASLNCYFNEVGREDLLTPEEEIELAQRIQKGDNLALEKLVRSNLRFVISVAKQYQNRELSLLDLINEGNLGLIKAAEKFDDTKGFKFISYAVWWIRQSILQALAEKSRIVRLPLNKLGEFNKVSKASISLSQELERKAAPEEISEMLNLPLDRVEFFMDLKKEVSFDTCTYSKNNEKDSDPLSDVFDDEDQIPADNELIRKSLSIELQRSLSKIKERDADIVKHLFGIGCPEKTIEEVSSMVGLTHERVRQIRERVLKKLARKRYGKNLIPFLG